MGNKSRRLWITESGVVMAGAGVRLDLLIFYNKKKSQQVARMQGNGNRGRACHKLPPDPDSAAAPSRLLLGLGSWLTTGLYAQFHPDVSQFSTAKSGMRENSLTFPVMIVRPKALACDAISKSLLPMGVPARSKATLSLA